jgi:hypothetical protein
MSYQSLIKKNVALAFSKIQDLAVDITLIQTEASSFDFGNSAIVATTPTTKIVKGIVSDDQSNLLVGDISPSTRKRQVMVQSVDLIDVTIYDSMLIAGVAWSIAPPHKDDGYVVTLNVYREA